MSSFNNLYNGTSEGFGYVVDGYFDYAKEVIAARSIPDLRDGLKPVARRIIYSAHENKKPYLEKCLSIVSDANKLHPHGDQSVYGAFALLTDENGTCNYPLFKGLGNLGKVFSSKPPAAMRYPKAMINEDAEEFFKDSEVMELFPAEEGVGEEPKVLNATFPVVLVNGTMGMAVSVSTKIPSFNFNDVLNLTIKYLKNGSFNLDDIIVPDFPTGGILVKADSELAKIMTTGKGKLKIRARVEISGKEIIVNEVPYGKTIQSICKNIEEADIKGIKSARFSAGRGSTSLVTIECKSKAYVDSVLMELYKRNILQTTYASNILVVEDGKPFVIGVHDIIKKWVAWRRGIVTKKINRQLQGISEELTTLSYFIRLISNDEWRNTYVNKVVNKGKRDGDAYLHEIFEDIPQETCNWIIGRALSAFNRGGTYQNRYNSLNELKASYIRYLQNVDIYIIDELEALIASKGSRFPRKTDISYTDYKFSKVSENEIEDTSFCVYTLMKSGFLKKTRNTLEDPDALCVIEAQANSILIGFDNFGRLLRIKGSDIEFTSPNGNGVYLPKYFEASFQEDYKVLYLGLLDGKMRMLVYRDGYVGFLNTEEFLGKNVVKIVKNGVDIAVYDKLLEVIEEENIPQYLMVADDSTGKIRLGVAHVEDIAVRSRVSRAKVFKGKNPNISYLHGFDYIGLLKYIANAETYLNNLVVLKNNSDFLGDPNLMEEGRYLDICKDIKE